MEKRDIIIIIAATLFPLVGLAQDLNPTVEVTNAYENYIPDAIKPPQKMAVPDSLLSFRLDFDYSISDSPYKGAYSFQPYSFQLHPDSSIIREKSIFLKAGAGYSLHPYADFVWSVVRNSGFRAQLYVSHHSYFGQYRSLYAAEVSDDDSYKIKAKHGSKYGGHDSYTVAGVNANSDFDRCALWFNAGYFGIHTKNEDMRTGYNAFDINFAIQSHEGRVSHLYYRAELDLRYARESMSTSTGLGVCDISLSGSFGPVIGNDSRLLVDFEADVSYYNSLFKSNSGIFSVIPRYVLQTDRARLDLGIRLAGKTNTDNQWQGFVLNACVGQFAFPDVEFGYDVLEETMNLYVGATGGYSHHNYSSIKASRHFFNPYQAYGSCAVLNNSVVRLDLYGGFRGNTGTRFGYSMKLGQRSVKNGLLDAIYTLDTELYAGVTYKDYNLFYIDLDFSWDSHPLLIEGNLSYASCNLWKKALAGFEPAQLRGLLTARYRIREKYVAGLCLEGCSRRRGVTQDISGDGGLNAVLPAWTNVSLDFEYIHSDKVSFWLAADNLLDMTIQRSALIPDSGLSITAGICFNL